MQVVLNKDVKKLGYRGEVVVVKNGYFRNFLYPNGLAVAATPSELKLAELRKDKIVIKREQILENAKDVLKQLKGMKVTIKAKTSEKGKLYAGVTAEDVLAAIEELYKLKLEKDFLKMSPIKDLGEHDVLVSLGDGLEERITVVVDSE